MVSVCDTYTWAVDGKTYTASGIYTGTTTNCITQKLDLTITTSYSVTTKYSACTSYTWANNGKTYTVSGIYTGTTTNCVTQKLDLTINPLPSVSGIGGGFTKTCAVNVFGKTIGETPELGFSYSWSPAIGLSSTSIANPIANPSINTTYTVTKTNTATKCSKTATVIVTVSNCDLFYTYTQGYYNSTGKSCTPIGGTKVGALALIQYSVDNMDGILGNSIGKLYLGKPGASFTLNYVDASKLVLAMPGGGTAAKLTADYIFPLPTTILKTGKINNVLLSQTITLSLNTSIPGNGLNSFVMRDGNLTTIAGTLNSCPKTVADCSSSILSSMKLTTNTTLMNLLKGQTVDSLQRMASKALGGILPVAIGVSYADINNAVDVINRSFDGGRFFVGYYTDPQTCTTITSSTPLQYPASIASRQAFVQQTKEVKVTKLAVNTFPNPFTNSVTFTIESPVSGNAYLDLYNELGQKVANVYNGYLQAGRGQVIKYNATGVKGTLIYSLKVGDKQVDGKVIYLK